MRLTKVNKIFAKDKGLRFGRTPGLQCQPMHFPSLSLVSADGWNQFSAENEAFCPPSTKCE